jgi:hypothetical protein
LYPLCRDRNFAYLAEWLKSKQESSNSAIFTVLGTPISISGLVFVLGIIRLNRVITVFVIPGNYSKLNNAIIPKKQKKALNKATSCCFLIGQSTSDHQHSALGLCATSLRL